MQVSQHREERHDAEVSRAAREQRPFVIPLLLQHLIWLRGLAATCTELQYASQPGKNDLRRPAISAIARL
jgi:hypothetical protein